MNHRKTGRLSLPTGIAARLHGTTTTTVQIHGPDTAHCVSKTLAPTRDEGDFFKAR